MRSPRCKIAFAGPTAFVWICLSVPIAAAEQSLGISPDEIKRCTEIAEPAIKEARADATRKSPAEVQKRLPMLFERLAGRPELPIVLGCLLRYDSAR